MATAVIGHFDFFSWESLRAGWYLSWRIFVRLLVAAIVIGIAGVVVSRVTSMLGIAVFVVGGIGAVIWSTVLIPTITSQWARERYGHPLTQWASVWWGITWRTMVVSLVATVILGVPSGVAMSFQAAYANTTLGALGGLMVAAVAIANSVVSFLGTGWAMSRVAVAQLGGLPVAVPMIPMVPQSMAPVARDPAPPSTMPSAPAPRPAPRPAPTVSAPAPSVAEGTKRQCPKCGLYETERGSVIGWYCKVCGWREARG